MSKLHLNFASGRNIELDKRRAETMGMRFIEGLRTLSDADRRIVFSMIGGVFCTGCGSQNPSCSCGDKAP